GCSSAVCLPLWRARQGGAPRNPVDTLRVVTTLASPVGHGTAHAEPTGDASGVTTRRVSTGFRVAPPRRACGPARVVIRRRPAAVTVAPGEEMTMRFRDQVAVITAAASGIGKATAEIIGSEGGIVVGVDTDQGRLDKAMAGIRDT